MSQLALAPRPWHRRSDERLFELTQAARLAGVEPRQLQHWVAMGLVKPSIEGRRPGRGGGPRFDEADLEWIVTVSDLVVTGVRPSAIASAMRSGALMSLARSLELAARRLRSSPPPA